MRTHKNQYPGVFQGESQSRKQLASVQGHAVQSATCRVTQIQRLAAGMNETFSSTLGDLLGHSFELRLSLVARSCLETRLPSGRENHVCVRTFCHRL